MSRNGWKNTRAKRHLKFRMNLEALILAAITRSEQPLKAAQVVKLVKAQTGRAATPKAVATALAVLEASGQVACLDVGKTRCFTTHSFDSVAAALLRPVIQKAKQPTQAAKLRTKLPPALQAHFESALANLVTQGHAFVMPGTLRTVHARRPKPSELLSTAKRRAVQKILDEINALRARPASLTDFAAWLDEETPGAAAASPTREAKTLPAPDEPLLREWYEQDRQRSSTVMVPISHTFARYAVWASARGGDADSQTLRNVLSTLYNEGRILLEPCERPQDLPEHERELLVPMSLGPPGRSWCWST